MLAVLAQAPEDVLGVDDGIVHDFAERDGKAAQHHDVEIDAEVIEHEHGADQRDGDRGRTDEGGAALVEKQEQHHDHQHRADENVALHVADRGLDEVRGPEEAGMERDALGLEERLQLGERRFERQRGRAHVRAELALHHEKDARPAVDERCADGRRGSLDHPRDVTHPDRAALAHGHHRIRQLRRIARLALRRDDDALIRHPR